MSINIGIGVGIGTYSRESLLCTSSFHNRELLPCIPSSSHSRKSCRVLRHSMIIVKLSSRLPSVAQSRRTAMSHAARGIVRISEPTVRWVATSWLWCAGKPNEAAHQRLQTRRRHRHPSSASDLEEDEGAGCHGASGGLLQGRSCRSL